MEGSTSTECSSAKELLTLFRRRQLSVSLQTEISGLPWFILICQSMGKRPEPQVAVFNTMKANGEVRAWNRKTRKLQASRYFFNGSLTRVCRRAFYYYRMNGVAIATVMGLTL